MFQKKKKQKQEKSNLNENAENKAFQRSKDLNYGLKVSEGVLINKKTIGHKKKILKKHRKFI